MRNVFQEFFRILLGRNGLAYLPMMPEGIDDSSDAPPMLIPHRPNDGGSSRSRPGKRRIRVVYDHHHPDGASGKRLRTEILVLRRLISHPKLGPAS